jgi:hypothetical protein
MTPQYHPGSGARRGRFSKHWSHLNGSARVSEANGSGGASSRRYGYQPNVLAQALARGTTMSIGVLVQSTRARSIVNRSKALRRLGDHRFYPTVHQWWNIKGLVACPAQARRVMA